MPKKKTFAKFLKIKKSVVEGAFEQRSTRDIIIMAREINMDTMRQNFWAESIKKETQMRRSWFVPSFEFFF